MFVVFEADRFVLMDEWENGGKEIFWTKRSKLVKNRTHGTHSESSNWPLSGQQHKPWTWTFSTFCYFENLYMCKSWRVNIVTIFFQTSFFLIFFLSLFRVLFVRFISIIESIRSSEFCFSCFSVEEKVNDLRVDDKSMTYNCWVLCLKCSNSLS